MNNYQKITTSAIECMMIINYVNGVLGGTNIIKKIPYSKEREELLADNMSKSIELQKKLQVMVKNEDHSVEISIDHIVNIMGVVDELFELLISNMRIFSYNILEAGTTVLYKIPKSKFKKMSTKLLNRVYECENARTDLLITNEMTVNHILGRYHIYINGLKIFLQFAKKVNNLECEILEYMRKEVRCKIKKSTKKIVEPKNSKNLNNVAVIDQSILNERGLQNGKFRITERVKK